MQICCGYKGLAGMRYNWMCLEGKIGLAVRKVLGNELCQGPIDVSAKLNYGLG